MVLPPHIKIFEEKNVKHYNCTACDKTFKSRDHCRYHRYCHSAESKPFSCSSCDKKFSKKTHLSYHLLTHTGELPFKCDQCDKGFRTNQKLKRHLVSHSGEKLVSCYICDKKLSSQDGLRVHLRTHSERRPFKCKHCDASFKDRRALSQHTVTHSGEKNWVCEICGKEYTKKCNLIVHKHVHASSRQFVCKVCGRDFVNQFHFNRHLTIHSEYVEEYICKICDKVFTRKDNLSRHVKNSHFEDADPKSETVYNCIKESKQKIIRKPKEISTVMRENTTRSSVIKFVASVIGMAKASTSEKQALNSSNSSCCLSNEETSEKSKEQEEQSYPETFRAVSVISRIGSSSGASQKATGYKILRPLNERLKLVGSNVAFDATNCSVAKALKAESIKKAAVLSTQNSNVFKVSELNSQEKPKSHKPPKLEPFRVINQPNLALNLSAKRATYCVKKCIFDASKNAQRKNKEQPMGDFQGHCIDSISVMKTDVDQCVSPIVNEDDTNCAEFNSPNSGVTIGTQNNNLMDDKAIESDQSCESLEGVGISVELEIDDASSRLLHSPSTYFKEGVPDNKIENLEYSYSGKCPDLHFLVPKTDKVYALSHFSSSFESTSVSITKRHHSSVIADIPNLIPILSNESSSSNSINCYSDEINLGTEKECLSPENSLLHNKSSVPSTSASLDLSVRKLLS